MKKNDLIIESILYIDSHLQESVNLEEIASHCGYSSYHFSRIFKENMGESVMDYVKKRRLQKAYMDILAGERILDAALKVGYQSHAGFTKAFKQQFGFTPAFLKAMKLQKSYIREEMLMKNFTLQQTAVHATKEELFEQLKREIHEYGIGIPPEQLEKVYEFACNIYEGYYRYSGDEYITHFLNTAILLTEMEAEPEAILAGLICDSLDKKRVTETDVEFFTSPEVLQILKEINNFNPNETSDQWNENTILVLLAERIHNMRTLEYMPEKMHSEKSRETISLYILLANKIGNRSLAEELKELSLKYMK